MKAVENKDRDVVRADAQGNGHAATSAATVETQELVAFNEHFRFYSLIALTIFLIGLCVFVAFPFLPAITWGVALAIIAWPVNKWVLHRVHRPALAAALTTVAIAIILLSLGAFVTYSLALEAGSVTERIAESRTEDGYRERLHEIPAAGQLLTWMERLGLDIEAEGQKLISSHARDFVSLVNGSVAAAIQFLVALFILYYLFLDAPTFRRGLRDLLPLSRDESDRVFNRAADSVHANVYATFVTALIDGVCGGLLFWAVGLPAPILWGFVMFVLSFLPIVGTGLVWGPAAAYLVLSGRWLAGLALAGGGLFLFLVIGNFLYVRLAGKRMRMHPVTALIAFLGGIAVFGVSGMILGPAIWSVMIAFLEIWRRRLDGVTEPCLQGVVVAKS